MLNRNTDSIISQSYLKLGELSYELALNSSEGLDGTKKSISGWEKLIELHLYLNTIADVIDIKNNSVYRVVGISDEEFNGILDCLVSLAEINDYPVDSFLVPKSCSNFYNQGAVIPGPSGTNGISAYTAIVFASDSNGTDFSTNPSPTRKYVAFKTSNNPIPITPVTFTGLWVKYIGEDGNQGASGLNGTSYYTYIRFASDLNGTGFSVSHIGKEYVAFLTTTIDYSGNPPSSAFSGLWTKFIGENGINGIDGIDGNGILSTLGPPSNAIGNDGDFAIDRLNWKIHFKQGGTWDSGVNLIGPQGSAGTSGVNGLNGIDGEDAYLYIAWADDALGNGYTTTFNPAKEWIAVIQSTTPLTPIASNFTGKYAHYRGTGGDRWKTFSTSLLTIGTGVKALLVEKNLAYSTGQRVVIAVDNDPSNRMEGLVISYDQVTGQLTVDVTDIFGSGTYSSWDVNLSAAISGTITSDSFYAEIYVDSASAAQALTTSYQKLTAFATLGDVSSGMAASHSNDNITSGVDGEFFVYANGVITGDASQRFDLQLFKNGSAIPGAVSTVIIDATPNPHTFSLKALQAVNSTDVFDLRVKAGVGTPDIIVSDARFGMYSTGTLADGQLVRFGGDDFDTGTDVIIDGFSVGTGGAFIFEYKIKKGNNIEKGRIEGVYDSLGDVDASRSFPLIKGTIDVTLKVDINSGNVRLLADIVSDDWEITGYRYIL